MEGAAGGRLGEAAVEKVDSPFRPPDPRVCASPKALALGLLKLGLAGQAGGAETLKLWDGLPSSEEAQREGLSGVPPFNSGATPAARG